MQTYLKYLFFSPHAQNSANRISVHALFRVTAAASQLNFRMSFRKKMSKNSLPTNYILPHENKSVWENTTRGFLERISSGKIKSIHQYA